MRSQRRDCDKASGRRRCRGCSQGAVAVGRPGIARKYNGSEKDNAKSREIDYYGHRDLKMNADVGSGEIGQEQKIQGMPGEEDRPRSGIVRLWLSGRK